MKRLRVLHVYEPADGGVPRYVAALRQLDLPGVEQRAAGPEGPDFRIGSGARSPLAIARFSLDAIRVAARFRPDIVHLHSTLASPLACALRYLVPGRVRVIYSPHAWHTWSCRHRLARLVSDVAHRALRHWHDHVACLSEDEIDEAKRLGYRRYAEVGSQLPPDRERGVPERDRRTNIILFVGRGGYQKGDDYLPALASRLSGTGEIVAIGPDIRVRGDNLTVLGPCDDVNDWYARAGVLVQPSRYEGLSLVTIEALTRGLPIVGFDVPGMRWVAARNFGSLVPLGDLDAMACEIARYLAERSCERQARADRAAREFADPSLLAERVSRLYRETIQA